MDTAEIFAHGHANSPHASFQLKNEMNLTRPPSLIREDLGGKFCISLQTYLSVSPLSLRVDCAVALSVLASWLWLWRVPLEGTAELETLVLCWHGNAEPWEAFRVQVGLYTRRHTVGALETSPPAMHSRPRAIRWRRVSHAKAFLKLNSSTNSSLFLLEQARLCFHYSHYYSHGCDKPC